ncbi:MAG UNVERIFIED_CONTAM: hypothetical protein LVR18_25365 [Planctomycetaceae bacterium]|jgi:hypothetical protein
MQQRQLGIGGPMLSLIGLGTWAIGGSWKFGWGDQDDEAAVAAVTGGGSYWGSTGLTRRRFMVRAAVRSWWLEHCSRFRV